MVWTRWLGACLLGLLLIGSAEAFGLLHAHAEGNEANGGHEEAGSTIDGFDQLKEDYKAAYAKFREAMTALRESDEYKEARKARDYQKTQEIMGTVSEPFYAKWQERAAAVHAPIKGKEAELELVAFMLSRRLSDKPGEMTAQMIRTHTQSKQLGLIASSFGRMGRSVGNEESHKLLQTVVDQNEDPEIKSHALFARAQMLMRGRDVKPEDKALGESFYAKIQELLPADHLLCLRARGPKFQEERLQIGMQVPDIEGVDMDGVAFKLSDYHGKVIMLDFWGHW